ncbi:M48 family metallopeptidase [Parabacteroides sp. FAFU027]|uniref:M48 family metallopeptidase n=1 Tax=Parabacteroides sp. FAFU027 TaxID=2922715 RepID=UPI001FAF8DF5|nr:M48 family metallopeptidase [Parabacteroides sp. FAFU027]
MAQILFFLIIIFVIADFALEQTLSILNRKMLSPIIPEKLKGIYEEEKYAKQQNYTLTNSRFSDYTRLFTLAIELAMLLLGGFAWVDEWVRSFPQNEIVVSLSFFAVLYIGNEILTLPFAIYNTFWIEEKFGFNKTTPKTFVLDLIKSLVLSVVLMGGVLWLVLWLYQKLGDSFWLATWGALSLFSLVMLLFYSEWIVPLFNKQKPLEEGELRTAIESFCGKAGFSLKNIFVIDGSKRSTKANAYFTGFGKKKRVVLFDTLIEQLNTEEVVAVLAHEVGHYKRKHVVSSLIISFVQSFVLLYLLSIFLKYPVSAEILGVAQPSFHIGVVVFGLLYQPVSTVLGLVMNLFSRRNEYQADAFAGNYGLGDALVSGLKKISVHALSNLNPHPAYVFVHYSHPTLLQRMEKIRDLTPALPKGKGDEMLILSK